MTNNDKALAALKWLFDTFEGESNAFNLASIRKLKEHEETLYLALTAHPDKSPVTGWQDIETAPRDGTPFYARVSDRTPMRWKPYKKAAQDQGYPEGRWQEMDEYGGWKNTEYEPKEWQPNTPAITEIQKRMRGTE